MRGAAVRSISAYAASSPAYVPLHLNKIRVSVCAIESKWILEWSWGTCENNFGIEIDTANAELYDVRLNSFIGQLYNVLNGDVDTASDLNYWANELWWGTFSRRIVTIPTNFVK